MTKKSKLLDKALTNPRNMRFDDMVTLVEGFGFHQSRVKGSPHIFSHPQIPELVIFKMSRAMQNLIRSTNF